MDAKKKKIVIAAAAVGVPLLVSFIFAVSTKSPTSSSVLPQPQPQPQPTEGLQSSASGVTTDISTSRETEDASKALGGIDNAGATDVESLGELPGDVTPAEVQAPAVDSSGNSDVQPAIAKVDEPTGPASGDDAAGGLDIGARIAAIVDRLTGVEEKAGRIAELEARIAVLEKAMTERGSVSTQAVRETPKDEQRASTAAVPEARFRLTHAGFTEDGGTVESSIAVDGPGAPSFTLKRRDASSFVLTVDDSVSMERIPAAKGRLTGARLKKAGSKRQFVYSSQGAMEATASFVEGAIKLTFTIDRQASPRTNVAGRSEGPAPSTTTTAASLLPTPKMVAMPVNKDWNVQAITPNIAVIFRNDTREMLAVSVGSTIVGCGLVQTLDIGSRSVRTDSCEIR